MVESMNDKIIRTERIWQSPIKNTRSMCHVAKNLYKRVHRGLFRSKNNIYINADTNAAYNIIRKSEPNAFNQHAKGVGGCGVTPKKIIIETTKNLLEVSRRL